MQKACCLSAKIAACSLCFKLQPALAEIRVIANCWLQHEPSPGAACRRAKALHGKIFLPKPFSNGIKFFETKYLGGTTDVVFLLQSLRQIPIHQSREIQRRNSVDLLYFAVGLVLGLYVLIWSADKFVDGSSAAATRLGMSKLLVGMIIVGFGTSAPEMLVSALASLNGNAGIAIGNAYGSNIANIALILGITVLIRPISIERNVMVRETPILLAVTLLSYYLIWDGTVSRLDAVLLLALFFCIVTLTVRASLREEQRRKPSPELEHNMPKQDEPEPMPMKKALFWLIAGLALLIASSRLLVWSAVGIANYIGISDIIIGLTIVAVGTSLPELASAIAATRKNEHSLVIGNIIGSNFFNALAVVGLAGVISPLPVEQGVLVRDMPVNILLTLFLFVFGMRVGRQTEGIISRFEGGIMVIIYGLYTAQLISIVMGKPLFSFLV